MRPKMAALLLALTLIGILGTLLTQAAASPCSTLAPRGSGWMSQSACLVANLRPPTTL